MTSSTSSPSGNWAKLKATLPKDEPKETRRDKNRKLRKEFFEEESKRVLAPLPQRSSKGKGKALHGISSYVRQEENGGPSNPPRIPIDSPVATEAVIMLEPPSDDALVLELREMVAGRSILNESKKAPGHYIAIDCEMVGVNVNGSESAVARVSIVNYHGHILLDTFVRPKERITDFRTWISGIREEDLRGAPGLEEVQEKVTELCEGRMLIGHAIENDLQALFLSHPRPMIRDTQRCKALREKSKSKMPGLSRLAATELGLQIQKGSHSSVTDARATMALYRLHKGPWEQELRHATEAYKAKMGISNKAKGKEGEGVRNDSGSTSSGKRRRGDDMGDEEQDQSVKKSRNQNFPGGGRKGISSGLGVVIRRNGVRVESRQRGVAKGTNGNGQSANVDSGSAGNWWESV